MMKNTAAAEHAQDRTPQESFFQRLERGRERRFLKNRERTSNYLIRFRNQRSRRFLVSLYCILVAALAASSAILAASVVQENPRSWFMLPWMVCTAALMVVWTMLNITVDMIDSAPMACLDEYERMQVEGLRSFTHQLGIHLSLAGFFILIFFGTWILANQPTWAYAVPYVLGICTLPIFLVISALPTAVIAWNLEDFD